MRVRASGHETTHQGFLSSLGSEFRIGSPGNDIVAHLLGPIVLPFVAIDLGPNVVPSLSVSTYRVEGGPGSAVGVSTARPPRLCSPQK